jgi:EAL domain-containing protein (putative c-di-GMP-specific phosphodiesterase class I)
LAIDDYGSGNASISYLRRFDVDILKIDRSLVDPLTTDEGESRAIVRSIIELATALGLETVGEGIETVEQLGELRTMGCHIGQGYHLARPMAAEAATLFVQRAAREHVGPLLAG